MIPGEHWITLHLQARELLELTRMEAHYSADSKDSGGGAAVAVADVSGSTVEGSILR